MAKDLDPHKDDVYRWEDSWPGWDKNHVTLKDCRTVIDLACRAYDVSCPVVKVHHKRSISFCVPTKGYISLQGWAFKAQGGLNVATALHEAAHYIAWHLHKERIQDHGPTFFGIYLDLLIRAKVAPRVALEATARTHKLRWKYNDSYRIAA